MPCQALFSGTMLHCIDLLQTKIEPALLQRGHMGFCVILREENLSGIDWQESSEDRRMGRENLASLAGHISKSGFRVKCLLSCLQGELRDC